MQICWCEKTVLLAIGILSIAAHGAVHSRLYVNWLSHARDWLRSPLSSWRCSKQAPNAFKDRLAEDMLHRKIIGVAQDYFTVVANCLALMILCIVWNLLVDRPRWMTNVQTAAILGWHLMLILVGVRPVVTRNMVGLMNGLAHVTCAIFIWKASPEYFMFAISGLLPFRIIANAVNASPAQTMLCNGLVGCVICFYASQHPLNDVTPGQIYINEICANACILLLVAACKKWVLQTIHEEIDAGNLKIESSACKSLLDMVCDVILELGKDLTILHDSRAFAAMLMRSSGASVVGLQFCEFLAGEQSEVEAIRSQMLGAEVGSTERVGTCRARLSDSMCNTFEVEIFFVRVPLNLEDERYVVGIRELSDAIPTMRSLNQELGDHEQGNMHGRRRRLSEKGTPPRSEYTSLQIEDDGSEVSSSSSTQDSPATIGRESPLESREELSESKSERAAVGECSRRFAKSKLRWPHLAATRQETAFAELLVTISSLNLKVRPTQCCPLHAYLLEVKKFINQLSQRPCSSDFAKIAPDGVQCQTCGMFQMPGHETECVLCNCRNLKHHDRGEGTRKTEL